MTDFIIVLKIIPLTRIVTTFYFECSNVGILVRWVNEVVENPESEASCPNIRSLGPRPPLLIRLFVVNFNSDLDISNFIVI